MEQLQITINEKPIFTVSEISRNLKKSVEDNFKNIRVRGEVSSFKLHGSGHSYLTLKDDQSVIDAIVWRGTRLDCKLEDGLEVIAQGYLTTYPSRSKYQIIIESAEPSGEGALLKLLMERKSRLEAEGLFARKRPIPGFPKCIGVVSSPTGAVIRDILHRIKERFPTHVILWPVAVQGEGAAEQIARAIEGFNMLPQKPDVIIVARGGGSLEDLWAFNEEIVVRAAASSSIPLISAVGHETDYTLIDFAADLRAPTPTAAAELATPVIRQLFDSVDDHYRKLRTNIFNLFERIKLKINGLARGIPEPHYILDTSLMRFDDWSERLHNSFGSYQEALKQNVIFLSRHIKPPQTLLDQSQQVYGQLHMRFNRAANQHYLFNFQRFESIAKRLELCAFPEVLKRGFCIVMDGEAPITSVNQLKNPQKLTLHFQDGSVDGTFSQ